jgi:hypothetical protein
MKSKNKLYGASNFRAWKARIDLILSKNKVLDIVKGKIVEPKFEEGKEKEQQNVAVMEKFRDSHINAMSIIVEYIKYHLIPYISHLESSKKMYDALTNLFSVRNIGQVLSLKNELRDMKMNDDDNITSYFVRISQLRYQLQDIEEIILEKELVNIVLNGLPKTWDAFSASMNTRKEYPTFQELWTCCAQEELRISAKEKPSKKFKQDKTNFFFQYKVTILFIVLVYAIYSVHILHIHFLEDNMFKEKLYLWKNNKIRIYIIMTSSQTIHMKG